MGKIVYHGGKVDGWIGFCIVVYGQMFVVYGLMFVCSVVYGQIFVCSDDDDDYSSDDDDSNDDSSDENVNHDNDNYQVNIGTYENLCVFRSKQCLYI